MPSETVFWSGKVSWVKAREIDRFGRYGCVFHPNSDAYNEIMVLKQEGLMNGIKKDDDGYYLNVSRPPSVNVKGGKVISLGPIELLSEDGKTPYHGEIGNGTDATLKVEIRRYNKPTGGPGVSIRLQSIRLDHLIPITSDDFPPARKKAVSGLDTAPRPWET